MFDIDPRLAAVLAGGAPTLLLRLTVFDSYGGVREVMELPGQRILSGSARTELRRDVRRSASMVLANIDGTLAPAAIDDLFAQGSRVQVETGALLDLEPLFVPHVTGFVTVPTATMRGATVSVTVESYLSACAQEAGEALSLTEGTSLPDALRILWDPVLPGATWYVSTDALGRSLGSDVPVLPTDNRLDVGLTLARNLGCEAYDDRLGNIVVRVRADPTSLVPVGAITDILDMTRSRNRLPFNAQPVEATPGDLEPIYVVAEVTDPASPVYRGRIGLRMAPTIRSDAIPDAPTALAVARMWLAGRALAADTLDITEVAVHPERDEGDVVVVEEPITRTNGLWQLETVDTPLGPGAQSVTARAVLPMFLSDDLA